MTTIANLTCEYRTNPLGIDVIAPRLSWQLQTDRDGARQTAYRVFAASDLPSLAEGQADLWDSGKVETDQSVHVVFGGKRPVSRQRVYWKVAVWDETGSENHSDPAWCEMGLLKRGDWKAKWIGGALLGGPRSTIPAPYLRKSFTLPDAVKSARLYVTALGLYECSINGQRVGEDVLNPGWTDYRKRIRYQVYDVADLLHNGENVIGAILGDGWTVGHIAWNHPQQYAVRTRLLAHWEITLADGHTIIAITHHTWHQPPPPLLD